MSESNDQTELNIEDVFKSAVNIVQNLPREGSFKPSDELRLKLYAYFKQATHGANDTAKPMFYQIVQVYKWDAWRKLGDMKKEEAMQKYIDELKEVMKSIPQTELGTEHNQQFEEVLGKRFYDYWFGQWEAASVGPAASGEEECRWESQEEPEGGVGDQFAEALLRLQRGLERSSGRLDTLETQVELLSRRLEKLEVGGGFWWMRGERRSAGLLLLLLLLMVAGAGTYCSASRRRRRRQFSEYPRSGGGSGRLTMS